MRFLKWARNHLLVAAIVLAIMSATAKVSAKDCPACTAELNAMRAGAQGDFDLCVSTAFGNAWVIAGCAIGYSAEMAAAYVVYGICNDAKFAAGTCAPDATTAPKPDIYIKP